MAFLRSLLCFPCRSRAPKLHLAVARDRLTPKKLRRSNVEEVDGYGRTALHFAAMFARREAIRVIIAEIKRRRSNCILNYKDKSGNTALHLAAESADVETIQILVQAGCDINERNNRNKLPWQSLPKPRCKDSMLLLGVDYRKLYKKSKREMTSSSKAFPRVLVMAADNLDNSYTSRQAEESQAIDNALAAFDFLNEQENVDSNVCPFSEEYTSLGKDNSSMLVQPKVLVDAASSDSSIVQVLAYLLLTYVCLYMVGIFMVLLVVLLIWLLLEAITFFVDNTIAAIYKRIQ